MTEYTTHHFQSTSTFTVSIGYDRRLYPYDIDGSIAHVRMLGRQGIVSNDDARTIVGGLEVPPSILSMVKVAGSSLSQS